MIQLQAINLVYSEEETKVVCSSLNSQFEDKRSRCCFKYQVVDHHFQTISGL